MQSKVEKVGVDLKQENILNVVMEPQNSILNCGLSYGEMARTVANHMVSSRGSAEVKWRPFINQECFSYDGYCRNIAFDAKKLYPDSKNGDVVYTACNIFMEKDYEVWINVIGCVQVFLDGKQIFSSFEKACDSQRSNEYISIPVSLEKGANHRLVIKTVCTDLGFGYKLNLSPPRCPSLWANFYLFLTRVLLPIDGVEAEEGIAVSPLYCGNGSVESGYAEIFSFEAEEVYGFPKILDESKTVDFKKIYGDGNIAYAYTEAIENGYVRIQAESPLKIFINGDEKAAACSDEHIDINLNSGDKLIIKSQNKGTRWGFKVEAAEGVGLEFLDTPRKNKFTFTFCGPFYQKGFNAKLPVERAENIFVPFPNGKGENVFWRFENSYLRAYIDSAYFGHWYYATMLSQLGILQCGKALDEPEFEEYFMKNQRFLAKWYDYAVYDYNKFGFSHFMSAAGESNIILDHIGTMGVNFIEAYQREADPQYLRIIEILKEQIKRRVSRFPDGTFCRKASNTMWADDFYMSGPFLTLLCSCMNDEESLEDIGIQAEGFLKRLYMPDEKIFSHIYFLKEEQKNSVPWGRGNGWIAFSMSDMLLNLPTESDVYKRVKEIFAEFCEGLANFQDESGLWHQVLNKKESYLETSGSAMFTLAFYRGVRLGILPEKFKEYADKGLNAILSRCVDKTGTTYGVCMGSSCSMNPEYYFNLPSVKDDNHGTGVIMLLLCEKLLHTESNMEEQK